MKLFTHAFGAGLCALAFTLHLPATAQAPAAAGQAASRTTGTEAPASAPLQNIYARQHLSLNGRWNYIIDPYEMGYYDYRHEPFDASPSGKGGFYEDLTPKSKNEWVE